MASQARNAAGTCGLHALRAGVGIFYGQSGQTAPRRTFSLDLKVQKIPGTKHASYDAGSNFAVRTDAFGVLTEARRSRIGEES